MKKKKYNGDMFTILLTLALFASLIILGASYRSCQKQLAQSESIEKRIEDQEVIDYHMSQGREIQIW